MVDNGALMAQLHKEIEIINQLTIVCKKIMDTSNDPDTKDLNDTIVEFLLKKFEVNEV